MRLRLRTWFRSVAVITFAGWLAGGSVPLMAQDLPAGLFTAEQAERGAQAYASDCAACHGDDLVSTDAEAPSLSGFSFNLQWAGKTLAERHERIHTTMPLSAPGSLDDQTVFDIIAFILATNGYEPGETELTADSDLEVELARVP